MNFIKNFSDNVDSLLERHKKSETQEITADDFVLVQFSTKTYNVLCVGQVKEKVAFTCKVKCMRRHGETLQMAFSDKDNVSETEGEDNVAKFSCPVASGETARTAALKYCSVISLRKELCGQRNGVLLWTLSSVKLIYFQ